MRAQTHGDREKLWETESQGPFGEVWVGGGFPVRLGSHRSARGRWGGGLGLGEAPFGAPEVSKPRIATPGRRQSGQLGGSDLGVAGRGWGLCLGQVSPEHTGLRKQLGFGSLGLAAGQRGFLSGPRV